MIDSFALGRWDNQRGEKEERKKKKKKKKKGLERGKRPGKSGGKKAAENRLDIVRFQEARYAFRGYLQF